MPLDIRTGIAIAVTFVVGIGGVLALLGKKKRLRQAANPDLLSLLNPHLRKKLESHLRPSQRITGVGVKVGEGHFGEVSRATYCTDNKVLLDVAIKGCKANADNKTKVEFLQEAGRMIDFDHPNVIILVAIVIHNNRPYLVLPFMENKDLKRYVHEHKNVLTVHQLMTFALHVAKGMTYLAAKKFVHRDLAARNCMVDGDLQVKVGDFGLARGVYYEVNDQDRPLPVAWMAPETLPKKDPQFTSASDVWSFGVLFWEVMTCGSQPVYKGPDLLVALQNDERLGRPANASKEVYALMRHCWQSSPGDRPTFPDLVYFLEGMISW